MNAAVAANVLYSKDLFLDLSNDLCCHCLYCWMVKTGYKMFVFHKMMNISCVFSKKSKLLPRVLHSVWVTANVGWNCKMFYWFWWAQPTMRNFRLLEPAILLFPFWKRQMELFTRSLSLPLLLCLLLSLFFSCFLSFALFHY